MGTRAGRTRNPTFAANVAGPWRGGGGMLGQAGTATVCWPPALTNLISSYGQICLFFFFFFPPHSNLKATLHSKDASGVSRIDFYVVQ